MRSLKKKYGWQMKPLFKDAWYDLPDGGRAVKQRLLHAIVHQRNFTMAFTGISNTAGHDNRITESYPMVLEQLFKPVLQLAGVNFHVLNGAMGNTDFLPYSYCVEAHAGAHPDVVSWEMGMEVGNRSCRQTAMAVEAWIRAVLSLPSRPVPLLLNCQADRGGCARGSNAPSAHRVFERVVGRCEGKEHSEYTEEHQLTQWYREYGLHGLNLEFLLAKHACGNPLFAKERLYGGKMGTPRTKSWHPGPPGHLLMAEVLMANYIGLLDVAYREELAKALGLQPYGASGPPRLPEASYCFQEHCTNAGAFTCLTSYYPNWEDHTQLTPHVVDSRFDPTPKFQVGLEKPDAAAAEWIKMTERACRWGANLPMGLPAFAATVNNGPFVRCLRERGEELQLDALNCWGQTAMIWGTGEEPFSPTTAASTSFAPQQEALFIMKIHSAAAASGFSTSTFRSCTNSKMLLVPQRGYLPSNTYRWEVIVNEPLRGIHGFLYDDPEWPIDRKWVIAGGASAGPLHLNFEVKELQNGETAPVLICRQLPQEQTQAEQLAQPVEAIDNMELRLDGQVVSAERPTPQYSHNFCWQLDTAVGNGVHTVTVRAKSAEATMLVRISHLIVPK
ncbi:hypothetical protein JKP88DRAFT_350311 [Tribonema minus]|uniref:Uncharacterized protein n=1 Tax=Tribonema minus TaxID=303371 RepID=A0A835YRS9_9STRA|nr:hypothetical protein JKP88DRAFT_350311 [Tribonema minus]